MNSVANPPRRRGDPLVWLKHIPRASSSIIAELHVPPFPSVSNAQATRSRTLDASEAGRAPSVGSASSRGTAWMGKVYLLANSCSQAGDAGVKMMPILRRDGKRNKLSLRLGRHRRLAVRAAAQILSLDLLKVEDGGCCCRLKGLGIRHIRVCSVWAPGRVLPSAHIWQAALHQKPLYLRSNLQDGAKSLEVAGLVSLKWRFTSLQQHQPTSPRAPPHSRNADPPQVSQQKYCTEHRSSRLFRANCKWFASLVSCYINTFTRDSTPLGYSRL